jgi:hypothetical protein
MAETSYPFGTSDVTTELEWSRMARLWQMDGVVTDDPTASDLKVTIAGSNISIAAGEAWINGFYYKNSATKTIAITNNAGGVTRNDRVVLRSDQSGNVVTAVYVTGGASPPVLSVDEAGVYEFSLAKFGIGAGTNTLSSGTLVDERPLIGKDVAINAKASGRNPRRGMLTVEGTAAFPEIWMGTGSGWVQIHPFARPAWNNVVFSSGWTNYDGSTYVPCQWARFEGNLIVLQGLAKCTVAKDDFSVIGTLPVGARPLKRHIFTTDTSANVRPRVDITAAGQILMGPYNQAAGAYLSLSGITYIAEG